MQNYKTIATKPAILKDGRLFLLVINKYFALNTKDI